MSHFLGLADNTEVMARTAEMLALPQMVCRRDCRRRKACFWHFKTNGEPCCLRRLTPDQRRLFDELYDLVLRVRDHGGWNGLVYASRAPELRMLEDAAVEIVAATRLGYRKKHFDAFRRARARLPPAAG